MALRLTLGNSAASDAALPSDHAEVSAISGERVSVLAAASAPPGAPVELVSASRVFEGRVRSCQRVNDGRYRIELRLVNFSKPAREELEALMAPPPPQD